MATKLWTRFVPAAGPAAFSRVQRRSTHNATMARAPALLAVLLALCALLVVTASTDATGAASRALQRGPNVRGSSLRLLARQEDRDGDGDFDEADKPAEDQDSDDDRETPAPEGAQEGDADPDFEEEAEEEEGLEGSLDDYTQDDNDSKTKWASSLARGFGCRSRLTQR